MAISACVLQPPGARLSWKEMVRLRLSGFALLSPGLTWNSGKSLSRLCPLKLTGTGARTTEAPAQLRRCTRKKRILMWGRSRYRSDAPRLPYCGDGLPKPDTASTCRVIAKRIVCCNWREPSVYRRRKQPSRERPGSILESPGNGPDLLLRKLREQRNWRVYAPTSAA